MGESTGQTFGQSQTVHSVEGIFHPYGKIVCILD
jgi:hypothetical protein